jgi:hypothetical protein
VANFEENKLYLDAERSEYNRDYQRRVIHHEFFHIIDYKDDGLLYEDKGWASLNPAGFTYGSGGVNAQGLSTSSLLTDRFPGFLNHYSTTGVEEDKAEVFANLIARNQYVLKKAERDPVIKAKIAQMKTLLRMFCPEMNESFWTRISERPAPSETDAR